MTPPLRLLALGLHYGVVVSIYLALVVIVGLQNFLGTIYADRKRAYRRTGQVGVRLWFAT